MKIEFACAPNSCAEAGTREAQNCVQPEQADGADRPCFTRRQAIGRSCMTEITALLRETLQTYATPPLAFEALWDGDTEGWHLSLFAVVCDAPGQHRSVFLLGLVEPGGDFRLFNNQVPPWNESVRAAELGALLSAEFSVPFHFPALEWPEEDCPHWWELPLSSPCSTCGIALLQRDSCPWRGQCYRCLLNTEHARREALLTPEERAGPRCHVCGRPAEGTVRAQHRCEGCRQQYEDYDCSRCGGWTMILRAVPHTEHCSRCEMILRLMSLTPAQRESIVDAGRRGTFFGLQAARSVLGTGLADAQRALHLLMQGDVPT